jgi:hypothetical protein
MEIQIDQEVQIQKIACMQKALMASELTIKIS